jgi:hypothetical protein
MPLGFPSNPQIGDTYVIGSTTYIWNGTAWLILRSNVSASTVNSTGTIITTSNSQSVNTTSGALIVSGGIGAGGNLYIGGNIVSTSTNSTIIYSSGSFETLYVTSGIPSTNTSSGALVVTGGAAISGDLYLGGILYSGGQPVLTSSTFAEGFQDGDDIDIVTESTGTMTYLIINNISTLQSVTDRGNSTTNIIKVLNTTNSTTTDTGALIVSGGIGLGGRLNAESIQIADAVLDSTKTLVNTDDPTIIDSYNTQQYRGAKYLIQIDEGTGSGADFELIEILLVADNNGNVFATEYGVVTSNGYLGNFDTEFVGGVVNLYFTANTATNKTIKVLRTGITT